MPFPRTLEELSAGGYLFSNQADCGRCGRRIQWWTTPQGKKMPIEVRGTGDIRSHFGNCNGKNKRGH